MRRIDIMGLVLTLLTGCMNDTDPPPPACSGVAVTDEGAQFCVHRASIIERGFRCPPERPHRHEQDEAVVCTTEPDADPEQIRRVVHRAGLGPATDAGPMEPRPEPDAAPMEPRPEPDAAPMDSQPEPDAAPMDPPPDPEPRQVPDDLPKRSGSCVEPLDVVTLGPGDFRDFPGVFEWVVTDMPQGSITRPVEQFLDPAVPANGGDPDDTNTPTALMLIDVAGDYALELRGRLHDDDGDVIYNGVLAHVRVRAGGNCEELIVELRWDTPGDDDQYDEDGTDLDLHLAHPRGDFGDALWDCGFENPAPDWGNLGELQDNCELSVNDNDGAGPESITMGRMQVTEPLGSAYVIGVHYYGQHGRFSDEDYGASTATIKVFVGPYFIFEASSLLENQGLWWVVGELHRDQDDGGPSAGIRAVLRDTIHDQRPVVRP